MKSHTALLIVDVQQAFTPPFPFVLKIDRYARRFTCRIFTQFINPPESLFRRALKETSCAPGTADTALLLAPRKGDLIFRKEGCYGLRPRQVAAIRRRRINHIIVCGLDTDACVLGVMFSLFDAGIRCELKEDLCFSSSGLHKPALEIIRAQFPRMR